MRFTPARVLAGVIIVLLIVGGVVLVSGPAQYKATAFIPAGNPNIIEGAPVLINGFDKGKVDKLVPQGQGAELTISTDSDVAPLHTGAVVFVQWSAAVGERLIQVNDGPPTNPEIPDGGRIEGNMPRPMELSDVLGALDPATRARLSPLVQGLRATLDGHEQDVNATLRTAGPAFTAVGNVLRGVAVDEPAINQLVNDTNELVGRVGNRSQDLSGIIDDLSVSTRDTAAQREQLRQVLRGLPPTLDQARSTLDKVPGTTDAAVPLLEDARSATDKLPSVARNLAPVLRDLRPTIAELKPTLEAASELLNYTPGLLDSGHNTLPRVGDTFGKVTPTLADIQPFTPCLVGFLSTWGSAAAYQDANGPFARIPIRGGPETVDDLPPGAPSALLATPVPRTCDAISQGGSGNVAAAGATSPAAIAGTGGLN